MKYLLLICKYFEEDINIINQDLICIISDKIPYSFLLHFVETFLVYIHVQQETERTTCYGDNYFLTTEIETPGRPQQNLNADCKGAQLLLQNRIWLHPELDQKPVQIHICIQQFICIEYCPKKWKKSIKTENLFIVNSFYTVCWNFVLPFINFFNN